MVGRTDDHRVDVFVADQFAVVVIFFYAIEWFSIPLCIIMINEGLSFGRSFGIEITDRDDLGEITFPNAGEVMAARDTSCSDRTYVDPVAGRVLAKNTGRNNGWNSTEGDRRKYSTFRGFPDKRSARQF
jgi:hypothetical protein